LGAVAEAPGSSYRQHMRRAPEFAGGAAPRCGQSTKYDSVLSAAAHVFCRDGFTGTSLDSIACEAGVSRQTVYNHHGDKEALFIAVVREMSDRCSTALYTTLITFPDRPRELESELIGFGTRLIRNCQCSPAFTVMLKILQMEGQRYPGMVDAWRDHGPGAGWAALAGCFAKLAHAGYLEIDDAELAARQFVALINAELTLTELTGSTPSDAEIEAAVPRGVRTFLRAFAPAAAKARSPRASAKASAQRAPAKASKRTTQAKRRARAPGSAAARAATKR
jgi:AcrR family transcriptional regulator